MINQDNLAISGYLAQSWARSRWFRWALIVSLVWVILRLSFALAYAAGLFPPELTGPASLPMDLPVYLKGGQDFLLRQNLYPEDLSSTTFHYPYSPPFAMFSIVLLWLPAQWVALLGTILSIFAYGFTYWQWGKIFQQLKLGYINEKMALTLPVWLIFSAFWGDLSFLNVGILVALIATLLIKAVLEERLGWATLWLTLLLFSKLMWAFPVALPLLLGRRRFFWKLVVFTGLAYLAVVGLSIAVAGSEYLLQQYAGYFHHLKRISTEFPWRVWTATPILGYNQSIKQVLIFFLGDQPWVQTFATVVKLALLTPLALVGWRLVLAQKQPVPEKQPQLSLDLAFVLYLGAFIWLDIVWEVLLGIVIFSYLLATLEDRRAKTLIWVIFLPYALVDIIQLVSLLIGGESVILLQGGFIITDPSLYFPLMTLIILCFYGLLMKRLWNSIAIRQVS